MMNREAAKKALEALRQIPDYISDESEESDDDFEDNDEWDNELEEIELDETIYSSDDDDYEDEDEYDFDEENDDSNTTTRNDNNAENNANLDRTSKDNIEREKMKIGDNTRIRNRIVFKEKGGITSYAANRIDETALSAFLCIFDMTMIKLTLEYTNLFAKDFNASFQVIKVRLIRWLEFTLLRCLQGDGLFKFFIIF